MSEPASDEQISSLNVLLSCDPQIIARYQEIAGEHVVSREMAIDAGDRSLEGQHYSYEYVDREFEIGSDLLLGVLIRLERAEAKLKEQVSDGILQRFLDWRSIRTLCSKCGGTGVYMYSSTAIWRGGLGGQMLTDAVCDHCWGSGDETHTWVDLRIVSAKLAAAEKEREANLENIDLLLKSNTILTSKLAAAEKRCAELEAEVRQLDNDLDAILKSDADPSPAQDATEKRAAELEPLAAPVWPERGQGGQ